MSPPGKGTKLPRGSLADANTKKNMKTEHDKDLINLALSYLGAYPVKNGEAYIWNAQCKRLWDACPREELQGSGALHDDSGTGGWYFADDEALEDLGRRLENDETDAFSHWCADGVGVQFELSEDED